MSISYKQGSKCILKHCHDLYDGETKCKKKYVRCTLLCPNTNGIIRILSQVSGPSHNSFECTNLQKNCNCMHAEIKVLYDLIKITSSPIFQYILLCSFSPCVRCANAIIYSKIINAVIYDKVYEYDTGGLLMLEKVIPTFTVRKIEEIASGSHHGELCFIRRWSE